MRILCFGDSNTYGYDPRGFFGDRYEAGDRWVDLLAEKTGHGCINAGVNGRVIPRGEYALRMISEEKRADVCLLMLGTNDLLQGTSAEEAAGRMDAFLIQLMTMYPKILLICPPRLGPVSRTVMGPCFGGSEEKSTQMAPFFEKVAAKYGVEYMNADEIIVSSEIDGLHLDADQHE